MGTTSKWSATHPGRNAVASGTARNRLAIEAAIIVVAVVGVWAILYGPFLETCCGAADLAVFAVLWSAAQIGGLLTGATRDPGPGAVLIGLVIEALVAWALARWVVSKLRSKPKGTQ